MINIELLNCNNILVLPIVNSTNTWAHELINNENGKHATVLVAHHQTEGKGQRNNTWIDANKQTLMTSIILQHRQNNLENQFLLNMAVAVAIQQTLAKYIIDKPICIKWSNDIYVENKKIAGVLIENIIRGSTWTHSIVGIGININTPSFDEHLPNATSLFLESNKTEDIDLILLELIGNLNKRFTDLNANYEKTLLQYNDNLFGKSEERMFNIAGQIHKGVIKNVNKNGLLQIQFENRLQTFSYGDIQFVF